MESVVNGRNRSPTNGDMCMRKQHYQHKLSGMFIFPLQALIIKSAISSGQLKSLLSSLPSICTPAADLLVEILPNFCNLM